MRLILALTLALLTTPALAHGGGDLHNRQSPCNKHPEVCHAKPV